MRSFASSSSFRIAWRHPNNVCGVNTTVPLCCQLYKEQQVARLTALTCTVLVAEQTHPCIMLACRNLKDNPNVAENMAKCAAQREHLHGLLGSTLDSLELSRTVQQVIEAVMTAEQAEVRTGLAVMALEAL
jgi:hypothetical protein